MTEEEKSAHPELLDAEMTGEQEAEHAPLQTDVSEPVMVMVPARYAGFWLRAMALVLDTLALYSLYIIIRWLIGHPISDPSFMMIIFELVIGFLYYITLTAIYGQTLGKMVLGVRVIVADHRRLHLGTVLLRELLGKFVSFITLGIGYMLAGWNKEKRALHDMMFGTYVVIINEEGANDVQSNS